MAEIIEMLLKRRSVRSFEARLPEAECIQALLEAAMAAPTACNSQPWEFIVVTDAGRMDQLRDKMQFARYNAPCAIVVCGSPDIAHNSCGKHFWVQDCSAAMENILTAAVGLGLGGVWIGVYPHPSAVQTVQNLFNIPSNVIPLGIAMLGYPAEGAVPPARTQYEAQRVHWQEYEPKKRRAKIKNAKVIE